MARFEPPIYEWRAVCRKCGGRRLKRYSGRKKQGRVIRYVRCLDCGKRATIYVGFRLL